MQIVLTPQFTHWLGRLKDRAGKARVAMLLDRWDQQGAVTGDVKSVGGGVYEARIHSGPGYRLYFAQKKDVLVLLLIGGDKHSQERDIDASIRLLKAMKEKNEW
ncbi:type II toxin-antitoxin system RelE/ParE family toxin [Actinomyces urogenitalis]|uniref:type II toxin-antitoxin system RelE/ParE family toxin n=1 Tax=Actinomyces urogenitalis TaxID=103621 RepID=UPI00242DF52E|nr:type II toxin-antitoxin system RelE/ParE family toxin [Actinomyces urogenitalis]MCI7456326.1 type II toxin-antitoxin system RelE/ParE family toxin [Actinomyces urogenitalis]